MSIAITEPRVAPPTSKRREGGTPARRAMRRWSWRLFRREWRRQALILALLSVAVAATTFGLGVASNANQLKADPTFGTANSVISLPGSDPNLSGDIAAIQSRFGTIDVITRESIAIPGSVTSADLRAENPHGKYVSATIRLDRGRYPTGAGEVAMTSGLAATLGMHVGSVWTVNGAPLQVVGIVENPLNLLDQFALVAPTQAPAHPSGVSILVNAAQGTFRSLRLPSGTGVGISSKGGPSETASEVIVLVLGSLGLLFVGLMAVAGFTVMAQRRLRALGMLGSLGATDRHIRTAMLANGAAVGGTAAVAGTALGLAVWFAFAPTLESLSSHRIDRLSLPWWALGIAMILAFFTAVAAAWWPARTVSRIPVVAALSGRPPRPQPAHRFAAIGGVLLATGLVLLAFADGHRTGFIITGTVTSAVGLLFLAPLAIRAVASTTGRSPISIRLALRDLARYQARSGAALGAVTLAIAIASTIAISAAAVNTPSPQGNLPFNQLMLYVTPAIPGSPVPPLSTDQQRAATDTVDQLAAALHANAVLPLEQAYDPHSSIQPAMAGPGGEQPAGYLTPSLAVVKISPHSEMVSTMMTLYVATPAVFAHYGIDPSRIDANSDILSARTDLGGLKIFYPSARSDKGPSAADASVPKIQTVGQLPLYSSDPGILLTNHAMQKLGLQPIPSAWLIQTNHPLTAAEISTAHRAAASAGLYVENRKPQQSFAPLRNWATVAGILLALGVLGMTVGLIRSETANDLRTLSATGASSTTRRNLTGATAGALALLGALIGTAGAYAALLAWHRSDLTPLNRVPVGNLLVVLVGLPAIATVAGWLLAGREPRVLARRPIE